MWKLIEKTRNNQSWNRGEKRTHRRVRQWHTKWEKEICRTEEEITAQNNTTKTRVEVYRQ